MVSGGSDIWHDLILCSSVICQMVDGLDWLPPLHFLHQPLQFNQTNVYFKVLNWNDSTNYVEYVIIHLPMIDEKPDPRSKAKLLPPNCSTTMTSLKMLLALASSKQWDKAERKMISPD